MKKRVSILQSLFLSVVLAVSMGAPALAEEKEAAVVMDEGVTAGEETEDKEAAQEAEAPSEEEAVEEVQIEEEADADSDTEEEAVEEEEAETADDADAEEEEAETADDEDAEEEAEEAEEPAEPEKAEEPVKTEKPAKTVAPAKAAEPTQAAAAAKAADAEEYEYEEIFAEWNENAPALQALIDYVESVTTEGSADYIPVEDRIAVFDMDGTLYGELFPTYLEYYMLAWRILEDPSIEPDEEMLAVGRELRESVIANSFAEDMPLKHATQAARAYAGMTLNEFSDFVTEILLRQVDGFEGMTYGEAFYQPMIEVVEYLQDYDFDVYVVSGSDRFICRTLIEGAFDIPYENIIGMDVAMVASGQGDTDGLDYVFAPDDVVVRSDKLLIKNLKMNKVSQIVRDIGHQPVISFGNSSGDCSMHNYTIFNNPYKSIAFMLVADDAERDYANVEKAADLKTKWEESGYQVISMKDDFRTIYPENVVKTGSFHWAEELGGERAEPASEETTAEAETAAATEAAPAEETAAVTEAAPAEETAAAPAEETAAEAEAAPAEETAAVTEVAPAEAETTAAETTTETTTGTVEKPAARK